MVVGRHLDKPAHVRMSDWSNSLSAEQVNYAALDAYAAYDIWQRTVKMQVYGQAVTANTAAGTLVLYRYPTNRIPKYYGVVLGVPAEGDEVEVDWPPSSDDSDREWTKKRMTAVRHQILVSVQRIDTPGGSPFRYPKAPEFDLRTVQSAVCVNRPFTMLLNCNYVFTRPPLADPTQLPPREIPSLSQLDSSGALPVNDVRPMLDEVEEDAQELLDEDSEPRQETVTASAASGVPLAGTTLSTGFVADVGLQGQGRLLPL